MNTKDKKALLIALALVIVNGLIGHFFAPAGIMLTPVVIVFTSLLVAFNTKELSATLKSRLMVGYIILNDALIKLYSGGMHDAEGLGWINITMLIGALPAYGILLTILFKNKEESLQYRIIAACLFPIFIILYLYLFPNLGLGRSF